MLKHGEVVEIAAAVVQQALDQRPFDCRTGSLDRRPDDLFELFARQGRHQELRGADRLGEAVEARAFADEVRAHSKQHMHVVRRDSAGFEQELDELIGVVLVSRGFSQVADPAWFTRRIAKQFLELVHDQHKRGLAKASDLSSALPIPELDCRSSNAMRSWRAASITGSSSFDRLASAPASRAIGALPGRNSFQIDRRPPGLAFSSFNSGSRPARTRDDFPLPEVPTTAMKRLRSTRR